MVYNNKEFIEHTSGLFVASDGEIFVPSTSNSKEHFTYGGVGCDGYLRVCRNRKSYKTHRLVAECFIDNLDNFQTVDHINRDKTDNRVENLRWADRSMQNTNRGKYTRPNAPKNDGHSKKVLQYTLDGQLVREWPSAMECHRNGFNHGHVSACCNGVRKSHKKFIWKYKNEEDLNIFLINYQNVVSFSLTLTCF